MGSGNGAPLEGASPHGAFDPADLERAILRIQGVQAARVMRGQGGRISEVHVLAGRERGAKQLVRDVQSVMLTNFGLEIDYRTVSVVQLDQPPSGAAQEVLAPAVPPARRPAIVRLTSETASLTTEVRVGLAVDGHERSGSARGPATSGLRLVAQAIVDAVSGLLEASAAEVESAEIATIGGRQVAVVILRLATPRGDQVLSGSALVRKDANDAAARAALAALNRVIGAG